MEPVVASGGPLLALAGFIFLPLVWSIPEALVTAELSTTFPEAAGCVAWVRTRLRLLLLETWIRSFINSFAEQQVLARVLDIKSVG